MGDDPSPRRVGDAQTRRVSGPTLRACQRATRPYDWPALLSALLSRVAGLGSEGRGARGEQTSLDRRRRVVTLIDAGRTWSPTSVRPQPAGNGDPCRASPPAVRSALTRHLAHFARSGHQRRPTRWHGRRRHLEAIAPSNPTATRSRLPGVSICSSKLLDSERNPEPVETSSLHGRLIRHDRRRRS